jgi:putative ATP-dependent endonuclease of OLD family
MVWKGGHVRIGRIKIENFARLADLDAEVRGHLVVVGANDVGKTSLLRILNLTLGPTAQLYQQLGVEYLRDQDLPLTTTLTFVEFDDAQRALFYREIDIDPGDGHERLVVRLEVAVDPDDPESVTIARWFPGRGEVRSPSREQITALGWRYLPALRQMSSAHFDGATGVVQTLLRAVQPELGGSEAELTELLDSFNTTLESSQPLRELRESIAQHLSSSMPRSIGAGDLAIRTASDPGGSVLENVSLYLTRDGGFVPLSEQSDGLRQLISMTLFDLAEGAANVIAIDEPEIHLHPASQRTIAELLTRQTNQKILVTHSPYIVQRFDPGQVLAVHPDGSSRQIDTARFTVVERDQAHWWSPRMLEALTARFAILVEGVADRLVVEAAAKARGTNLDRIGAIVFELGGAENFPAVYKLLGPVGFGVEVLGLVDDAEKGRWFGAVGGRPADVRGHIVFVSTADLEEEYCRSLGAEVATDRLIAAGVARDEAALLSACAVPDRKSLAPAAVARFCRKDGRKVAAALAVVKGLSREEAATIDSVNSLLTELDRRCLV